MYERTFARLPGRNRPRRAAEKAGKGRRAGPSNRSSVGRLLGDRDHRPNHRNLRSFLMHSGTGALGCPIAPHLIAAVETLVTLPSASNSRVREALGSSSTTVVVGRKGRRRRRPSSTRAAGRYAGVISRTTSNTPLTGTSSTSPCINWPRQEPYVRAWSQAYRNDGLIVIGVHTPEFSFEHDIDGVRQATTERAIDYPVVVDNDYAIWNAFDNHFWPALYFVDTDGIIRDDHFGEGRYEKSERVIHKLLGIERELVSVEGVGVEAAADWDHLRTRETYLGYWRSGHFAFPEGAAPDERRTYELPRHLGINHWALAGDWTIAAENVVLDRACGSIAFRVPRARRASRAVSRIARADSLPRAPRRRGSRPVTRRGRRRSRKRLAPGRAHVPTRARARNGPPADAADHVPRARRRSVCVHFRVAPPRAT